MSAAKVGPIRRAPGRIASLALLVTVAAGCSMASPATGAETPSLSPVASNPATTADAATTAVAATAAPTTRPSDPPTRSDGPPNASIQAEGGDPVTGQLGSYTWADGGSDSPWLPGSPITVGAGEPLTVRLSGAAVVADWNAAQVAPGTAEGSGAVSLGSADGEPIRFLAPGAGRWSVQVLVRFGRGSGSAAYYWLLDVR
jgi:hypothetical protein